MMEVVVIQRRIEAEGICSIELAAVNGAALPCFEPGSHIDVHLAGGLVRQYSLCPESAQQGRYLIAVQRELASRGGSLAVHALQVGDRLHIGTPRNQFPLVAGATRSLLFAGGIGITPLLAMADHLAAHGQSFALHYGARSSARMAFAERLRQGAVAGHVQFHLDDGPAGQKLVLDTALGQPTPGTHVYVCGPGGFMNWVLEGAQALGWPEAQLHREYFAAPARADTTTDKAFVVQIGRGGMTYTVPAERSVIDVLAEHGVQIPVSCEQGVCGTCITRLLDGIPAHRDTYLTEQERTANDCFAPCCSRALSQTLVLDL